MRVTTECRYAPDVLPIIDHDDAIVGQLVHTGLPSGLVLSSTRSRALAVVVVLVPAAVESKLAQALQWHVVSDVDVPVKLSLSINVGDKGAVDSAHVRGAAGALVSLMCPVVVAKLRSRA